MNIGMYKKNKFSKKHQKQIWELLDIINSYGDDVEDTDIHPKENLRAKKAIIQYYHGLKQIKPLDNYATPYNTLSGLMGVNEYLNPIFKMYLALRRKNYCLAIWELTDIYPCLTLESRYYYNILHVLSKELDISD